MRWMKWKKKKKWTALVLSFAMLMNMIPQVGTIAVIAGETGCTHHSAHTAECGYVEAVEAHECTHVCGEECYTKTLTCPHTAHDETCGYMPAAAAILESPCTYIHDPAVCGTNEETCPHVGHDENCGYTAGVAAISEVPCGHEHTDGCYTVSNACSHVHDGNCGYAEAVAGSLCTFVCESCAQSGETGSTGDSGNTEDNVETDVSENTGDTGNTDASENTGDTGNTDSDENTGDTGNTDSDENTGDIVETEDNAESGDIGEDETTDDIIESEVIEESEDISEEEETTKCTCGAIVDGNGVVTHAESCPEYRVDLGDVDHIREKLIKGLYGSDDGRIICDFDRYTTTPGRHEGIDFAREPEASLYAVADGEIIAVSEGNDTEPLSKIVIYNKKFDRTVIYFHADPLDTLAVGMEIKVGDLLGYESNRDSADYHTHLELIRGWTEFGSISVNDDVLDNENPYPMWEEMLLQPSFFELLISADSLEAMQTVLNTADVDTLLSLSKEEVDAVQMKADELYEAAPDDEVYNNILETLNAIRDANGYSACTCGQDPHTPDCPLFVPEEAVMLYGGTAENPTNVTKTSGNVTWTAGYYKVPENTTVTIGGYVTVQNAVTLILGDGCTLDVKLGIRVTMKDNASLTINGNTGKLVANATKTRTTNLGLNTPSNWIGDAAIGGYISTDYRTRVNGPIIINGGNITAIGGDASAGIGTSAFAISTNLPDTWRSPERILRGDAINGMITINGGVINATGGAYAAGIGGGACSPIVGVTIQNATVTARAGSIGAAGIGGGYGMPHIEFDQINWTGGKITIHNSYITATGGTAGTWIAGAAIGDGFSYNMDNTFLPMSDSVYGNVVITGNSIVFANATQAECGLNKVIGALDRTNDVSIVFENEKGTVYGDTTLNWDLEIPSGYELNISEGSVLRVPEGMTLTNNGSITGDGVLIVDGNLKENDQDIIVNGEYMPPNDEYPDDTDRVHLVVNVYYMNADGSKAGPQHAVVLDTVTFEQDESGAYYLPHGKSEYGWFYVAGKLTTQHRFYLQAATGNGANTKIILGNGSYWTAQHGIAVNAGNVNAAELTIYREWPEANKATGILEAHGTHKGVNGAAYDTAGIGGGGWNGGTDSDSGEINIYGGDIRVSGAATAANIGSGEGGKAGSIVIRNAKVTSGDAGSAASIGAGAGGTVGTIDIGNSLVLATSDQTHNGIGDDTDTSGTLTIHDSVIFTDKIGPANTTYRNSLLFLNEKQTGTTDNNPYGHYDGTLKYASDENKTVTLKSPLVMPETATLTIKDGETLNFNPDVFAYFTDVEFTNNGKIYRDYGSSFITSHFTANDTIGIQVYEIIEEIDNLENDGITGDGVEIFNNNQVYSLPDKTVTVTSTEKSELYVTVEPEHSEEFESTAVEGTKNRRYYTMPADPVKLTGTVRRSFDLTITKKGVSEQDEDMVFIFCIENSNGFVMDVSIKGNGSVTIKDLPYDTYTVTEDADWSWRYEVDSDLTTGFNKDGKADYENKQVTFTNKCTDDKWLDGNGNAVNIFKKEDNSYTIIKK